jgi:hypothetical protein
MALELESLVQRLEGDTSGYVAAMNAAEASYRNLTQRVENNAPFRAAVEGFNAARAAADQYTTQLRMTQKAVEDFQATQRRLATARNLGISADVDPERVREVRDILDHARASGLRRAPATAAMTASTPEGFAAQTLGMVGAMSRAGRAQSASIAANENILSGMAMAGRQQPDAARRAFAARLLGIAETPGEADPLAVGRRVRDLNAGRSWWARANESFEESKFGRGIGRYATPIAAVASVTSGVNEIISGGREIFKGVWAGLAGVGREAAQGFRGVLSSAFGGMARVVEGASQGNLSPVVGVVGDVLGTGITALAHTVGAVISGAAGAVGAAVSGLSHVVAGGVKVLGGLVAAGLLATGAGALAAPIALAAGYLASKVIGLIGESIGGILGGIGKAVGGAVGVLGDLLGGGIRGGAGIAGSLLSGVIGEGMQIQRLQSDFEVLIGNAGRAKVLFGEIQQLAIVTPYTQEQLASVGRTLLGMGVSVDNLLPSLSRLGDIAGGDADRLRRAAFAFGEVVAEGRLTGQRIRQFATLGIGVGDFAETMGVSVQRFTSLRHQGLVPPSVVAETINRLTDPGGRFFEFMQNRLKTAAGQWQVLQDVVGLTAGKMGVAFLESSGAARVLKDIGTWITDRSSGFVQFAANLGRYAGEAVRELGRVGAAAGQALGVGGNLGGLFEGDAKAGVRAAVDAIINGAEAVAKGLTGAGAVLADVIDAFLDLTGMVRLIVKVGGGFIDGFMNSAKSIPLLGGLLDIFGGAWRGARVAIGFERPNVPGMNDILGGLRAGPGMVSPFFNRLRGNLAAQRAAGELPPGADAAIPRPEHIGVGGDFLSERGRRAMEQLVKMAEEGATELDKFRIGVAGIREAVTGSPDAFKHLAAGVNKTGVLANAVGRVLQAQPSETVEAAGGWLRTAGKALQGITPDLLGKLGIKLGPLAGQEALANEGLFQKFDALRKGLHLPNPADHLPAANLVGSAGAAEAIGRGQSLAGQTTLADVVGILRDAKEANEEHQREVQDFIRQFEDLPQDLKDFLQGNNL